MKDRTERGATMIEYVLITALVVGVLFVFFDVFWAAVTSYYSVHNQTYNYIDGSVLIN